MYLQGTLQGRVSLILCSTIVVAQRQNQYAFLNHKHIHECHMKAQKYLSHGHAHTSAGRSVTMNTQTLTHAWVACG